MKRTTILTVAAACGAFAFAVPDWNQHLNAAPYPNLQYKILDASVTQSLATQGCKTLKVVTSGDLSLYDDGTFVMYRDSTPQWASTPVTGTWAMVQTSKSKKTVYMYTNVASMNLWEGDLVNAASAQCHLKYPNAGLVNISAPTVITKKSSFVVKIKDNAATGTFQLAGKQQNDFKGTLAYGNISVKMTMKGTLVPGP